MLAISLEYIYIYVCVCVRTCGVIIDFTIPYTCVFFFQLLGGLGRPPIYIYIIYIYIYIYNILVAVWDTYLCSQLCFRFSLQDSLRGDAYALKSLHEFEQLEPSEEEGCWFEYIYIYIYIQIWIYIRQYAHTCVYVYIYIYVYRLNRTVT